MSFVRKSMAVCLLAVLVGYIARMGLFRPIDVELVSKDSLAIAFRRQRGSFMNIPVKYDEAYAALSGVLSEDDLNAGVSFYFDKPGQVEEENLRWTVGYVISNPTDAVETSVKERGFDILHLPASDAVRVVFPFRTPFSPFVGALRSYKKLYKAAKPVVPSPAVEFYNEAQHTIEYTVFKGEEVNNMLSSLYVQ
eukprot:CAMPEP_0113888732 /NCGR_PEP_ID=MMETSP0780_2-20120614/13047_1 /TAXON_ID=652834 /ORGANISM="Palpitomonas bilix" /LENGTH=193 /DNA_ID=CAMNT_0000877637 /DNA_START=50 /DNA_END=631 /DNA_ORIENTATION=- /assembly_acc=CAM_ASM_000599